MGQTLYTFNGGGTSGNWDDANIWTTDPTGSTSVAPRVPGNGNTVVVTNSFVVYVNTTVSATGLNVTVQKGGVLDLTSNKSNMPLLNSLSGQGTLRIAGPYFPDITTNNFDDANTGTVEFYNWPASPSDLPQPASNQYNNLRLLNTTAAAYVAELNNNLTLNGDLTLTRTNGAAVTLNLGKTASANRTLTIQGNVTVGAGTYMGVTNVAGAHVLNVSGSFVNNGTVRLHNGTAPTNPTGNDTQAALLNFTGATDANFACNGPTDLGRMQVDKGVDSKVLLNVTSSVNPLNATGNLHLNYNADGRILILVNGVAKFGNNIVLDKIHNGTFQGAGTGSGWYDLGSTTTSPTLWVAGASISNSNAVLFAIYGTYRISAGSFESITPDAMVIREDGQVLIEGGTTKVNKFRPSSTSSTHRGSFIMTGGVFMSLGSVPFTIEDDFARFSIPYTTQSFRMTGGTIQVYNPSNGDGLFHIGANPNNTVVTGGTIEVYLPNATTTSRILSTAPLWNLTIKKLTASGTAKAALASIAVPAAYTSGATIAAQPLTVLNNFILDGTNPTTFDAAGLNVNIQGAFTIGTGCTYLPGANTTTFSGSQNQLLANNGTIGTTAGVGTFNDWTVDKSAGTLTLGGSVTTYYTPSTATLSLLSGVLNDGGKTINVQGNMVNSATHTSGAGTGSITLAGASNQTVSGNDLGVFGNLTVNSTATAGTVAATMTANMSVATSLTLQSNHILAIGANRLWLTNVSTSDAISGSFSNQCFIQTAGNQSDLGLQKTYGGADNFTFPVGTGTKYAPAQVILALATSLAKYGQVSVSPVSTRNPFVTNGATGSLNYYWKVRSTGFGTIPSSAINMRFTMTNADAAVTAGPLTSYVPGRYQPVVWTPQYTDPNLVLKSATTSVIRFNSLNQFEGEYTAGLPAAFGTVTAYYSRASGNWADATTWSTTGFAGSAAGTPPGANNPVFVGSASANIFHTVTVAANNANSGSLVIDRGSVMDVGTTTGHNFGALPDAKVGGSGRLRVSSAAAAVTFPGGDFGSFLQENGGTVEYYTTGSQSFTLPTASGTLSLNSYRNLWLNASSNTTTITLPNLNLRVYAQLKTGVTNGTITYPGTVLLSSVASGNIRVDSLLAVQNGTFRYANGVARTLTADTDVRVDAGATFDVSSAGTAVTNALTVGRSLTNNGTLDFNFTGSRRATLTFTGNRDASLTGSIATAITDLYTLTMDKGTGQAATLNLDVAGALTTPTSGWLTLTNGTLRYAKTMGTLTIHNADSPYLIPDNAGLTVDAVGADVTVATTVTAPAAGTSAAADLKLAGQLKVIQGKLSVGATSGLGNDLEYASAGAPTIRVGAGGTLYVNGQIRRTTANTNGSLRYDQSGGSVEIGGARAEVYQNNERGLFEVQGPGSIFRMTGGTLSLRGSNTRPTIIADLYLRPDSTVVTAGTVELGTTTAGTVTVSVESLVPLYDVKVEAGLNASSTNTGLLTGLNPLNLKGSLTIANDNAYFNANGLGLNIDQNLVNNNSSTNNGLTNGGFRPSTATQTTTFTGKGPAVQQLTSTTANLTVFGSLVVNNAQTGGTLQLGRNARVIGALTIAKGTLADNGQTLTVLGDVSNSALHTSTGSGSLTLAGTTNQNIGGNGTGRFGNVILNNTAGATTTANQEITNVLTLSNGVLSIGSNLLWLSNTAAGAVAGTFGTTKFIRTNGIVADLGLRKSYPAGALNFTFPVGAAVKYTPVQMNVTTNATAGTITVQPIDLAHPSTTDASAAKDLSYYWKVSTADLSGTTLNQVFTYTDNGVGNDVNGTETNYKLGRFLNGAWNPLNGIASSTVDATNNTLTNSGTSFLDGDYTGGEISEFGAVPTFYSRNATAGLPAGAIWTDASAWTFNADGSDSGTLPTTYPTLANPVVIRSGHLITTNIRGMGAATLQLLGTLDLGTNVANNFSTVTGTGTLRIGSALFPAGNYSGFVAASTGTVNFTGAVQLPARDTYNNLTLSGGTAKQLTNLDLTINGALNVAASTTVDNPTSQNIALTSTSSGATVAGTFNLNDGKLTTGAFLTTTSTGAVRLGAGAVSVGTYLTNAGSFTPGTASLAVGTVFTNNGTYNASNITTSTGSLAVAGNFINNGTFSAGTGSLDVTGNLTNANGGNFTAGNGAVNAAANFLNAGIYSATTSNIMRVNGEFSNLTTGFFDAASSAMVLRGNFINTGGANFNANTGQVLFLTNANQFLTGNTTFYDLKKQGPSVLTLGTNTAVRVGNMMTLQNGIFYTGLNTGNILYLDNTATQPILGNTLTSYVSGRLAMTLPNEANAIRVFPVGAGLRYRPVTIKPLGVSTNNPVVLVEIINGAAPNANGLNNVDATLQNIATTRYYRIQLVPNAQNVTGTISQPTVQLSFNTDVEDEEVNVPGNLRVARSNGPNGQWSTANGSGVFSPEDPKGYATSAETTIDNNSFFVLASTNKVENPLTGPTPLPVELLSFSAGRQGAAVRVFWATASEKNSAYFLVQRSADGRIFADIERVAAQGNSTSRHDYAALDASPLAGMSYYRLRQVDKDGTSVFSPVVSVRFDGQPMAPALVAYPNPASAQGFQLLATNLSSTGGTVKVFDSVGRLVLTQAAPTGTVEASIQPAKPLANGIYFVTWQTTDGVKLTTKVAVE